MRRCVRRYTRRSTKPAPAEWWTGAHKVSGMTEVEVRQLLVSPAHRLAGRPAEGLPADPSDDRVTRVEVRRHLGLVGDRYYARPAHRNAAVTIMATEKLPLGINPST